MGIIKENRHTRTAASLFDVSHLGVINVYGDKRESFLEKVSVADIRALPPGRATVSLLMNKQGGIVDDYIITNLGTHFTVVLNGACKFKDWAFLLKAKLDEFTDKDDKLKIGLSEENAILALQGPRAEEVLQAVLGSAINLRKMSFLDSKIRKIKQIKESCTITRCGYTGEDGFEIMLPKSRAPELADLLLSEKTSKGEQIVKMAGLGCRDTLRQECGLCLYGHELNENIGPVEARLMWTVGKRRIEEGGFYGCEHVRRQLRRHVPMRRCGFVTAGRTAREQYEIFDLGGKKVGYITSGTYSPTLGKPIGMAYVKVPFNKPGTQLQANVRGETQGITIHELPFIETKYYRPK
eukprot:TRINITY_DN9346_c0_g4_i3.p1 TRINITY_DN9346_c0_g4~~TRINITY_DN9346_c0_g4_i3.p1  ORF type:complete len:352 (+),score=97.33 TRINITY_DN9346_c0_g4_i3:261-1316(+)